jgi:endonuclease VIII
MPEGDTLHRLAGNLRPVLLGRAVEELVLARSEAPHRAFVGSRIVTVEARGKNLLVHFDNGYALHVHLGMHGSVRATPSQGPARLAPSVAFVLRVEGIAVVGRWAPKARLLKSRTLAVDPYFRTLGEDLLGAEFDPGDPIARLRTRPRLPIGEAVMDQRLVAGIGNVYKSEVLFRQQVDPFAPVASLDDAKLGAILADARMLMQYNVDGPARAEGAPKVLPRMPMRTTRIGAIDPRKRLFVYRRKGMPCVTCGTAIEMRRQGEQQRSTYYCPTCQGVTP